MARETKPIVEILDPKSEAQNQALIAVKKRLDFHQNLIYAVLVVTAVGFIAVVIAVFDIFIQYKRFGADKYNEFVTEQDTKLQSQIDQMKVEIDNLWKNKYPIRR